MVRILIFALLATTGVVPLPWGHSHQGMQKSELAQHHRQFHLTESTEKMPTGWHWHFYGSRPALSLSMAPTSDPLESISSQLMEEPIDLRSLFSVWSEDFTDWKLNDSPQALVGPKIYLRLSVLRN